MNVLVATLGGSWAVVPEIVGFTNPNELPLYRHSREADRLEALRHRHDIPPVDEVWVATTDHESVRRARARLQDWSRHVPRPQVRCFWPQGLEDIRSAEDVACMAELIHRLAFLAHSRDGQVLLSLAGGRKTMSADLQRAGQILGCRAMLHVIDRVDPRPLNLDVADFTGPLPPPACNAFLPVVVSGPQPGGEAVRLKWDELKDLAVLPESGAVPGLEAAPLVEALEQVQREGDDLLVNYRLQLSGDEPQSNFRALYTLPSQRIEALRKTRIGRDPRCLDEELAWLRKLPKAELHCHLGGILSPAEMIGVAGAEAGRVAAAVHAHRELKRDLDALAALVRHGETDDIHAWLGKEGFRGLRRRWPVPEPLGVCTFLLAFAGHENLLARVIYGDWLDPARFHAVGIGAYERLGDLQGSGLLQSRATLEAAIGVLARQCREHNLRCLELRCSPLNYTRGGLTGEQVVDTLLHAIEAVGHCDIRLIFIASRHGDEERVCGHVDLARRLLAADEAFARRFVGFDLAGAEHAGNPARFRTLFRPLHERVIRLTIHAGEGEPVQNIWEAVYELNADRIGHGLTLKQDPELMSRFRDRSIALEMCPSSNFQIVGFRDHLRGTGGRDYPLADYLRAGLRVTVNTDDPGISLTDLTREYHRAAVMSAGGLSRWQVLQLVRNGFRAAFCGHRDRQRHLVAAEREIVARLIPD